MRPTESTNTRKLDRHGFTLIELVIIIVVLGIIAAVAIPRFEDFIGSAKATATRSEMMTIKRAIVGNPEAVSGGEFVDRGFEGDLGFVPSSLSDLTARPDSVTPYDKLTRLGWNGPYIDSTANYMNDEYGAAYIYQPFNRRILSVGGPDTIAVYF